MTLGALILLGGFVAGVVLALEDRADRVVLAGERRRQAAQEFASSLSRSMDERVQDVLLLAELDAFVTGTAAERRRILGQLGAAEDAYAWIGATDTDGVVLAASPAGLLEGAEVSQRPWWQQAQDGLFVGDLHDALLLAEKLTSPGEQPPRFVDIAVPLVDEGEQVGVLGAHLYWSWSEGVRRQARSAGAASDVDYFIFDADGRVILPPLRTADGEDAPMPLAPLDGRRGEGVAGWTDGQFVTGWHTVAALGDFDGLGWTAVTRRPLGAVTASSVVLGSNVVAAAVLTALVVATLAGLFVRRQTAKLRTITLAAQQLRDGQHVEFPQVESPLEVAVLSAALREMTDHLETRNRELTEALQVREQFTMMASHETRTPVTVISGAIETLQRRHTQMGDHQKEQLLDAIARNARRLKRLNAHLLAAAEIEAGVHDQQLETDTIRPAEVIEVFAGPHVQIEDPEELVVETDPTLVELTVSNLLDNADKYGQPPVLVTFEHADGRLHVSVRDHGPGVPPDFIDRLFDRYTQASEGERRTAIGVGLGLWLSRELLRRVGGDLIHEPVDGPGACFTAVIPGKPA